MSNTVGMIWLVSLGGVLGAFFFLGLSWTIGKGLYSKYAALWFVGSLLVRTSVTLLGFYFFSKCQFGPLLFCLLGFFSCGLAVVVFAKPACLQTAKSPQVMHHAP